MDKHLFYLQRIARILWLRAAIYALGATGAALLATTFGNAVPEWLLRAVGDDTPEQILTIIASSMLAVVAFSLATIVSAVSSVTANASPRAAALLLEDKSAHNALSSFIGAFIFSIVGLIALGTDFYTPGARVVLFLITLVVIALVVLRLLHWVDRVAKLGRIREAIDHVETETRRALKGRKAYLGGLPATPIPSSAVPLYPEKLGYVQDIDVPELQNCAQRLSAVIHLAVLPGAMLRLSEPVLHIECSNPASPSAKDRRAVLAALVIGGSRTFEQDPRFGLVVLAEISSRALSPALNDPGTAIDVIGTAVRLLSVWARDHCEDVPHGRCDRVRVPSLTTGDIFEDIFAPIARDGASFVEVGQALQKGFLDLSRCGAPGFAQAARFHSEQALRRAEKALSLEDDYEKLQELSAKLALPT